MKTPREKIEGLERYGRRFSGAPLVVAADGKYLLHSEVLRILSEHEKEDPLLKIAALFNGWANAGAPDGGPANVTTAAGVLTKIGAALGDPFAREPADGWQPTGDHMRDRMAKKPGGVTAADEWILHLNDCRGCSALGTRCAVGRKLHGGSEYVAAAEVPGWRREYERLHTSDGRTMTGAEIGLYSVLAPLAALAEVIASGNGEAAVPERVAKCMPIEGGGHHPAGIWEPWGDNGDWALVDRANGLYTADASYILTAIDAAGNALVSAA